MPKDFISAAGCFMVAISIVAAIAASIVSTVSVAGKATTASVYCRYVAVITCA